MSQPLSNQALSCLEFFATHPDVRINYRALMSQGVSKRRSLAILKELREANYIRIVKQAGGGTNVKLVTSDVPTVGTSGNASKAVQLVSSNSVSYTARTTNNATNKFFDEVEEKGGDVSWGLFESTSSGDDDDVRERAKYMAQKKAEYAEEKLAKAQARKDMHRSKLDPVHWTCKDVAYEFADRLSSMWNIAPFSVTQTRFVQALAGFRKQQNTDGAIELQLIDLFFATVQQDKYTDGNHLWRAFLYKAPQLLQQARENVVTAEQVETAIIRDEELTARKLALLEEDDV